MEKKLILHVTRDKVAANFAKLPLPSQKLESVGGKAGIECVYWMSGRLLIFPE